MFEEGKQNRKLISLIKVFRNKCNSLMVPGYKVQAQINGVDGRDYTPTASSSWKEWQRPQKTNLGCPPG